MLGHLQFSSVFDGYIADKNWLGNLKNVYQNKCNGPCDVQFRAHGACGCGFTGTAQRRPS
jgi:hypothetical protein